MDLFREILEEEINLFLIFLDYVKDVGVRRFELPTSTSRTWRANRTALHPDYVDRKFKDS